MIEGRGGLTGSRMEREKAVQVVANLLKRKILLPRFPQVRKMARQQVQSRRCAGAIPARQHGAVLFETLVYDAKLAFTGGEDGRGLRRDGVASAQLARRFLCERGVARKHSLRANLLWCGIGGRRRDGQSDAGGLESHACGEIGPGDAGCAGRYVKMRVRGGRNWHLRAAGEESFAGVKSGQIEANGGSTSGSATLRTRAGRGAGIRRSCRGDGSGGLVGGRRRSAFFAGCGGERSRRLKFRIGRGDRIRAAKNHDLADGRKVTCGECGRQVRNRDGKVRVHESTANSLLPVLIRQADQLRAVAVRGAVDGPGDRREPTAQSLPLIRRASRIGLRSSVEAGVVGAHGGQIPIRKKYSALTLFKLRRNLLRVIRKSVRGMPNQNMRAARGIALRGDDQGESESCGTVTHASGEIRGGGIFGSRRIFRNYNLPVERSGKTIAIGIYEPPSGGEWIAQMILRRQHRRRDLRLCERYRASHNNDTEREYEQKHDGSCASHGSSKRATESRSIPPRQARFTNRIAERIVESSRMVQKLAGGFASKCEWMQELPVGARVNTEGKIPLRGYSGNRGVSGSSPRSDSRMCSIGGPPSEGGRVFFSARRSAFAFCLSLRFISFWRF